MTYRHEMKFVLDEASSVMLRSRLKWVLEKDRYITSSGSYTVRSLYFDDYYNSAYNEKNMSILDREKYRIRLYNQSDAIIHLERKIKSNNYILKETAPLTRKETEAILNEDYEFLRADRSHLKQLFYHRCQSSIMRPRVVVDYEREPFIMEAGDVRITFDRNIRAGMESLDPFNYKMAMVEALGPHQLIMEVKYTNFLPGIVKELLVAPRSVYSSMSKYMLCCEKTLYKRRTNL
ncbi:MAG TPA: transporter [Anaerolineaceae bacterium]|nr:transporter [Anaerolineaceae bacterium]